MTYETKRGEGRFDFTARPKIVKENAVAALMDAGGNLGHPVSVEAMQLAIKKARDTSVGVVSVRNSHHFGAAGYYAKLAADEGLVGWVASAARGITVVPTGARQSDPWHQPDRVCRACGTQPAVRARHGDEHGRGRQGQGLRFPKQADPGRLGVGRRRPADDGRQRCLSICCSIRPKGGLTPVGGTPELSSHKGYGLGMMAHILGGVLSGGSFTPIHKPKEGPSDPENIGHFFMAMDPDFFRDEGAVRKRPRRCHRLSARRAEPTRSRQARAGRRRSGSCETGRASQERRADPRRA